MISCEFICNDGKVCINVRNEYSYQKQFHIYPPPVSISFLSRPLKTRRKILEENLDEIPNRIMLSESKFVTKTRQLSGLIANVIQEGLEGLVLKDIQSVYEPGKRHWLKVKKDYLKEGAMADSADLLVLGAYYGTGTKG